MNRRDLLTVINGVTHTRGECFLCGHVQALKPVWQAGRQGYECPRCGGMNSPKRIEDGLGFDGQPLRL